MRQPEKTRLGHHDRHEHLWVDRQIAEVAQEGVAEIAVRRFDDLERNLELGPAPLSLHPPCLTLVEREEDGARVGELERLHVVEGAQRGRLDTGDEDSTDDPVNRRQRIVRGDDRNIGDRDSRLREEPELQSERRATLGDRGHQGGPLEGLRNHQRDEARVPAW